MADLQARDGAHEWVSFEDPDEERTWVFDVTFMLSHWGCIFGRGCQGVLTEPAPELVQGCCSYGAHFVDAADRRRVERAAKTLTDEQWQFKKKAQQRGISYAEMERTAFSYTSIKDYVTAQQIADQILFLCSPRGRTISGQAISICGDTQMLG